MICIVCLGLAANVVSDELKVHFGISLLLNEVQLLLVSHQLALLQLKGFVAWQKV